MNKKFLNFLKLPFHEKYQYIFLKIHSYFLREQFKKCGKKLSIGKDSFIRGRGNLSVGNYFKAGRGLWLESVIGFNSTIGSIVVGNNFICGNNVHIGAANYVSIGNNVLIGSNVLIIDHAHGVYSGGVQDSPRTSPMDRKIFSDRGIVIGDNVLISDGVSILSGVNIGDGVVVGCNSVVTHDLPSNSLAYGIPAKVHKSYNFLLSSWEANNTIIK